MKKISEHLGEVIVALACVALFISTIQCYNVPVRDFFVGITDGIGSVSITVLDAFEGDPGNNDDETVGGKPAGDAGWIVPVGCTYYSGVTSNTVGDYTGATATYLEGETVYTAATEGDVFIDSNYEYRFGQAYYGSPNYCWSSVDATDSGWGVRVLDDTQSSYGEVFESINNNSVVEMRYTFEACTSLETAPIFPDSVIDMSYTFEACTSLTTAPTIPDSVTSMEGAFYGCHALETAPAIPDDVTSMKYTFYGCHALETAPAIPNGVTYMYGTFQYCGALETAPVIPDSVTNMKYTFSDCDALETAPAIPDSVTNMQGTFSGCTSLTTSPTIPDSVTNLYGTFSSCTSLETAPAIPDSVTNMQGTFSGCTSLTTAPAIPDSVTNMKLTFNGCTNLEGAIEINATSLSSYAQCFNLTAKNIVLKGSCPILAELAATSSKGNVTLAS